MGTWGFNSYDNDDTWNTIGEYDINDNINIEDIKIPNKILMNCPDVAIWAILEAEQDLSEDILINSMKYLISEAKQVKYMWKEPKKRKDAIRYEMDQLLEILMDK